MQAMEALCRRLVPIYATALDLPPDAFDRAYAEPHLILRLTHYPPLASDEAASVSLTPHTDSGFMTLLAPNPVPGLSILLPDGRWVDAPAVQDAFVVNGGDILHRWTNERFLSTPHRVINRTGGDRYAIPFFCDPNHDTVIECLPSCRSAAHPSKYPAINFGDYAIWFARRATSTWRSSPRLPTRRSRRAPGRRCAGEPRRRHPPGPGAARRSRCAPAWTPGTSPPPGAITINALRALIPQGIPMLREGALPGLFSAKTQDPALHGTIARAF